MKKKLIGLSTLLLVLLLGSFTTCYADLNRTWTENNIKNAIYNYRYSKGQSSSQIENYINTNANYITSVTNAFNSYNYVVILYQTSGSLSNMAFLVSNTNGNWYLNGNRLNSTNTNDSKHWIFPSSGTAWQNNGWCDVFFNTNYYYTSKDIYESYQSNTIRLQANTCIPSNLITSPYEDTLPLTFIPKLTNTYADVWTYEDVPFYNASGEDLYLGQLFQPIDYQGYKTSTIFYWQYGNWQFKELTDYATYSVYVGTENGSSIYDIYLLSEYINENMLYDITFTDITTEPLYTLASCIFYIKNNNTIITNGALDTSNTFSGDYKDKYDDDLQNEQDVNNISQAIDDTILDDSEVDNMLNGFNSSGDILDSLGYSPIENPFTTVILDVITQLTYVLLGSGNVTLDISAFDLEMVLQSEDFKLPNGIIKTFISLVSNGFMIWIIYKYGFKLYMEINTGKFKNLIDETTNTNINLF